MGKLYPRLARRNLRQNRRFFLPYLLALAGLTAAFYVMAALALDPGVGQLRGVDYVRAMMAIGMVVAGLFSAVLVFYINSFLMKQRQKELGLYNILGMGKGNIALVQCWESLYTALLGIGGGLAAGVLLHWLAAAALRGLLRFAFPFSAGLSLPAAALTVVVFGALLALTLLVNLLRVRRTDPIRLLHGGQTGEREPKARWLLALIGLAALAGGYAIAVTTTDPVAALAFYFPAVILVILGTYCLFTAGSIAVLKLLKRSKNFYYRTGHFIGVSGMLYRMKRNAVGLANICILCTMVMVMVSGTLALYLGTGEIIAAQYPADFQVEVGYQEGGEEPFNGQAVTDLAVRFAEEQGVPVTGTRWLRYLRLSVHQEEDRWLLGSSSDREASRTVYFLTGEDYAALTGREIPTQAALCGGEGELGAMTFSAGTGGDLTVELTQRLPEIAYFAETFDVFRPVCVVLPGEELSALYRTLGAGSCRFLALVDLDCTDEEALALGDAWYDASMEEGFFDGTGNWEYMRVSTRAEMSVEGYAMAGGFLFLGILLGLIFLLATALILYYKQVSEGYEDRGRFEIMRRVGLSRRQIRASVRSQVLTVFFLPIAAAAVHILFDFNLVVQLLTLFSVRNVGIVALCTAGTVLAFLLVYGLMYLLTARAYYKIVS